MIAKIGCNDGRSAFLGELPRLILLVAFEWRVSYRVVSEVETRDLVNRSAEPLRKVGVVKLATVLRVFVFDKLVQVSVIDLVFVAELFQNVFGVDDTVVVCVQTEKSLFNGPVLAAKLFLEHVLKSLDALLYDTRLILRALCQLLL